MKTFYLFIFTLCSVVYTQAKVHPVVHYNFGKAGNVTYAIAPDEISPQRGEGKLLATGRPVFFADAPGEKAMKGDGSIRFNGKDDGYKFSRSFGSPKENMLLEVWVKPRKTDDSQKLQTILANGNGKEGYVIAQRGKQWIFISGGRGITVIGNVVKDQWVHLAATIDNGDGSVWINGKKSGSFEPTKAFAPNFSIGISNENKEAFNGYIYEIRYSTFNNGGFNPDTDLLIDYKKKKEQDKKRLTEREILINEIEKAGLGKELVTSLPEQKQTNDWLINNINTPCKMLVQKSTDGLTGMFQITNGLISRTFYVSDNITCVGYKNLSNDAEYIRAVKPEARIRVDSIWYDVGGLKGQPEKSYLLEQWYPDLESDNQAFTLSGIETGIPLVRYPWQAKYNSIHTDWPAKGLRISMTYRPTVEMSAIKDLEVRVNYEIYQGIPVMVKWIEVLNQGQNHVVLNQIESEILAVNQDQIKRLHVESDFSFALVNANLKGSALMHYAGDPKPWQAGQSTTLWTVDEEYNTWATHNQAEDNFLDFPHRNLLISRLPMGPDVVINRENPFKSYLTFELLQDSDDRERKSLGHRRMYKKLAPQTTESLITGGITSHDRDKLKNFINQMAELGLERLDIQAWPGISHDNLDEEYIALWKEIADYAKERGIIMGGYELQIASRGRGADVDCVHPETGKQGSIFGQSVCVASSWKDTYFKKMWEFFDRTGLMTYNMDGPYHGDPCASTEHPHHRGLNDSQWEQWKSQVEVIHELQRRNMYVPIPDWYFLNGQSATGMGYREASSNLSPDQQMLLGRQYIYDGTWHKLPTMGWISLQLVGFYTNDPRVGLEPLSENLDRYEQQLIQFLASGCQFTIRGNRLYDSPETKAMVSKWINWFKEHREILTSEIIHVSRPNGRELDCMLHVNPFIKKKGMVVVFNPTDHEIEKEIKLPLYYTGLKDKVTLQSDTGEKEVFKLNNHCELLLPVKVKARGATWFVIEE